MACFGVHTDVSSGSITENLRNNCELFSEDLSHC
jgi:hypothetical protein